MAHDQEPTPTVVPTRRPRWRRIAVVTLGLVGASALLAVPAIAQSDGGDRAPTPAPAEKIVVCESGIVDHGDGIQTSSASAERVPADAPVPEGCTAP
ncbi:MAG: hypothetical protein FJW95_09270 [Actinobacteria bacterium]|nr:hypothetical protein [Actinomycetota bacterium]